MVIGLAIVGGVVLARSYRLIFEGDHFSAAAIRTAAGDISDDRQVSDSQVDAGSLTVPNGMGFTATECQALRRRDLTDTQDSREMQVWLARSPSGRASACLAVMA